MATLPPVTLGVIILVSFGVVLLLHRILEKRFVETAAEVTQPQRQFFLELVLTLGAGIVATIVNFVFYRFPIGSGLTLIVGCVVMGFFLGLDMALARERKIINRSLEMEMALPPPKRLYSMTRRFSLVAVTTAVCVAIIIVMVISRDIIWLSSIGKDSAMITKAQMSITTEISFIMAVLLILVINLIISYSRNLKLLFDNETGVLEQVSKGDLSRMVPVATRDEFGVIAGHTNSMIEALRHRIQLLSALKLAEEVQRNLLPSASPQVPGLDIAGTSIYCDETGGDYYDYIELPNGRLGVVVADASGHGIDAALHMTTARAFLLFAARNFQGPALMLDEVNQYLTRDSVSTSRFMSMFFLEVDLHKRNLRWVRAGHEPAMVYHPEADDFSELSGDGMAMGVLTDYTFKEYTAGELKSNSVVVITTDGIHESRNEAGEMFGMDRLRRAIKDHAAEEAQRIQTAIIDAVREFRGSAPQEDDITLVVIKVL